MCWDTWHAFTNIDQMNEQMVSVFLALCEVLYISHVLEPSQQLHEADAICRNQNVCP